MSIWIILSGIIAPAIFWFGYLYFKDRVQPEPFQTTGITYILGIFSAIWGYTVGVAWLESRSVLKASVLGIGLAALFHGLFNFLTTSPALRFGASILILIIWIWQIRLIERLRHKSKEAW